MVRGREGGDFFERRDLVEVAFDFELMSAKAGGFVPVKFCSANSAVLQSYPSYAFAFPPAAAPVDALQTSDFSDPRSDSDGFCVRDATPGFRSPQGNLFRVRPVRLANY